MESFGQRRGSTCGWYGIDGKETGTEGVNTRELRVSVDIGEVEVWVLVAGEAEMRTVIFEVEWMVEGGVEVEADVGVDVDEGE